ncbi:ankyrin repeat-containing domain protein [Xylaria digitata]|nr:ankyrin repeat-containing domain protein [Xylaria digitata]
MHLFDLAPELLAAIFDAIALSRQFNRLMRLRLVNRQFKYFIDNTIFRLRLLRDVPKLSYNYTYTFATEYLVYQVWVARDSKTPLGRIWRAAVVFSERAGNKSHDALMETLRTLCDLPRVYLPGPSHDRRRSLFLHEFSAWTVDPSQRELDEDLCVAAIYLGDRPYVEHLITQGWRFCDWGSFWGDHFLSYYHKDIVSDVFGSAFGAAATKGDVSMMCLLISSNPHYNLFDPLPLPLRACILKNAAKFGHSDAFNFALDSGPLALGRGPGFVYAEYPRLRDAVLFTPIVDNYRRGIDIFVSNKPKFRHFGSLEKLLARRAKQGHIDMMLHLLTLGASPNGRIIRSSTWDCETYKDGPLLDSVKGGSLDAVKVLLQHGADPNGFPDLRTPLMFAAWLSTLSIAKALLAAGANPNDGCPPPIVLAIAKEDTLMFRLLREHGARLDTPESGAWAMAVAQIRGYESMVELLVQEGVERGALLRRCSERGEILEFPWRLLHPVVRTDSLMEWRWRARATN